jgi:co-chaperonin GroES (HSP10)
MSGQNNGGNVLVKPLNKRLLLEQVKLEEKENNLGFFQLDDGKTASFGDFYKVLDKSDDCATMVEKGDLISAEVVTPLGKIEHKLYFVCHENSIIATIKE